MKLKIKSSVEKVGEVKDVPDLYRQPLAHDDADKWFDEIGLKNTEIKKIFIEHAYGKANIQYAGSQYVPSVLNDEIAIRFFILWLFSKSGGPVKKITILNEKPELFSNEKDISLSENINEKKLEALRESNDPQGFFDDFLNFIRENITNWTDIYNPKVNSQTLKDLKKKLDDCFTKMKEAEAADEIDIVYIDNCKNNYVPELNKIIPYLENYMSTVDYTTQTQIHYDAEDLNKLEIEKNKELEKIKQDQQNELKNSKNRKAEESKSLKDDLKDVSDKLKFLKSKENEAVESAPDPEEEELKKKQDTLIEEINQLSNKYKLIDKDIQREFSEKMFPINERYETLKIKHQIDNPDTTLRRVVVKTIEEKVTVNLSTAILKWKETKGMMSDSYGHIRKIVTIAKWNSFNLALLGRKAAFNKKVLKVLLTKGVIPEITNKNIFNYIYSNPSVRYNEENANENIFIKFNPNNIKFNHNNFYEFPQIMDWVRGRELTGQLTVRYYNGRPVKITDQKNYCNNKECNNYRQIVGKLPTDFFVTNQQGQDIVNNKYIEEGVPKMDPCLVCGEPGRFQFSPTSNSITYRQGQIKISEGFPMGLFMFNFPKHRQIIPLPRPIQINNEVGALVEVDKLICNEYSRPTSSQIEKMVEEYKWSDMYAAQAAYHRYQRNKTNSGEEYLSNTQDFRENNESILSYGNRITGGEKHSERVAGGYGWYWADLNTRSDDKEKNRMGHCGSAGIANSLFSLRVCSADYSRSSAYNYQPWTNYSKCTCSVRKNGTLLQMKGEHNSRPKDRDILEKLVDLFCAELKVPPAGKSLVLPFTGLRPINEVKTLLNGVTVNLADYAKTNMIQPYHGNNQNPGFSESDYQAQNDFHIMDLPDDLLKKFYESRPDFFEFKKCDEADAIMTRLQEIYRIEQGAKENQQNSTEQNTGN